MYRSDTIESGELPVKIEERDSGAAGKNYRMLSLSGEGLFESTLRLRGSKQSMDAFSHAVHLQKLKRPYLRSRFSVLETEPAFRDSTTLVLKLFARIEVPESTSIHEASLSQALQAGLESYVPSALRSQQHTWSPRDFYDSVYTPERDLDPRLPPLTEIECKLLPFQERAVRWMLDKEAGPASEQSGASPNLPYEFLRCVDSDGRNCFVSRLLGVITSDEALTRPVSTQVKGGILSEEMGLGKTVEMVALMNLNQRPSTSETEDTNREIPSSPATLIITPPAILQQWRNELQALAPGMRVYVYDGLKAEAGKASHEELMKRFSRLDVVLTTFNVLSKEIHYAEKHERSLRHQKRYETQVSPLTRTHWWRVVLDEAQMIEGGVSNAAKVATLIPRENAWCVSGTPVKKDFGDIFGLLLFLRYQPYSMLPKLWSRLVLEHKSTFSNIVNTLTLRHTKEQIKDELVFPLQKRVVITVPFTQIEEQHYSTIFQEMAEDCGLDANGGPLSDDWDPDASAIIAKMRMWLSRLRQTCLHPEVGARNRRALGGRGPLRTVNEVLEVMIEQNQTMTRTEERVLFLSQLRRGQILEHAEEPQQALDIWSATLREVESTVEECRNHLVMALQQDKTSNETRIPNTDPDDQELSPNTLPHRLRLRNAIELEHICVFFTANSHYQLKDKEGQRRLAEAGGNSSPASKTIGAHPETASSTPVASEMDNSKQSQQNITEKEKSQEETSKKEDQFPEELKTDRYRELEQKEEAAYERAKALRKEILSEARAKADIPMNKIRDIARSFTEVPSIHPTIEHGGIEFRSFAEKIDILFQLMQDQSETLKKWRSKTGDLLTLPLVDESETDALNDSDAAGKEYETSTKQQDESYVYVDALRALVSDRHDLLTGQQNLLIEHEMKVALAEAKEGRGHAPLLLQELLKKRKALKVPANIGSLRGLLTQLREVKTDLRGAVERNNSRAAAEMLLINKALTRLQLTLTEQSKIMTALDREVELFKDAMNLRLEYYRQLQAISDSVAPYEEDLTDEARGNALRNKEAHEELLKSKIATLKSKGRYLIHLRSENSNSESQRMCIICQHSFENGILTSCGHTYCVECLQLWFHTHRSCPACKKHLHRQDFHPITYKPQELTMEEEKGASFGLKRSEMTNGGEQAGIYSGIRDNILNQIKDIDLEGSFGTKIDTIARHILWIRQHDPGAKSIVFSQYKDFLDVLARAFKHFKIGYTGFERKGGIESFRTDPSMECFFLHAKAHSSGLNLVNATHVFLCEPLINTAIELQAIARVHRIGQQHETTVWMYLVEGTVEKSVYDISVQRRLAHLGKVNAGDTATGAEEVLESQLEVANTLEMEDTPLSDLFTKGTGGGEMVLSEDLWECLFRHKPRQLERVSDKAQREVARQLGADAAEARVGGVSIATI